MNLNKTSNYYKIILIMAKNDDPSDKQIYELCKAFYNHMQKKIHLQNLQRI